MAAIEINAPDGSIVRFPAGTPDTTIKDVMARNYGGPQQPVSLQQFRTQFPQYGDLSDRQLASALHAKFYSDMPKADFDKKIGLKPESWSEYRMGLARSAGNSALFNFGGELGLIDEAKQHEFEQEHPIASTVAGIAGSLPLFAAGPGAAAARWATGGANLLRTAGRSAGLGAGVGAVAGAGAGEGGLDDRLTSAATGAVPGAILGAAIPPAIAATGWAARQAGRLVPQRPNPQGLPPPIQPAGTTEDVFATMRAQPGTPVGQVQWVADGATPASLNAQDRALQVLVDQVSRAHPDAGRRIAEMQARFAGAESEPGSLDWARRMYSNSRAQRTESLADVPEFRDLLGSLSRRYPQVRQAADDFLNARQTGFAPAAQAESLAARGIPTVEEGGEAISGAQAKKLYGTSFDTAANYRVPLGHLSRVRDELRRAHLLEDVAYHDMKSSGVRTAESIVARAEELAQKNFADAYAANGGRNLYSTVNQVFARHIQRAALEQSTELEAYLRKWQGQFLRPTRKTLELQQFNNIKRTLDAQIRDDLAKPARVPRAGLLDELRKDLLQAVDDATGGEASLYRAARQQFSDEASMVDAYTMGRRVLGDKTRIRRAGPGNNITGNEVTVDAYNALTEGQQRLFRRGMEDALTHQAMLKTEDQEAIKLFRTPRVRELLTATIQGSKGKGDVFADRLKRFFAYIDSERRQQFTRAEVQRGSQTAGRLAADQALDGLEAVQNVQTVGNMLINSPGAWQALMGGIKMASERLFGVTADQAAEAARILLTGNRHEQALVLQRLAAMAPANRMARFNEVMHQLARHGMGPGAGLSGGMAGQSPQQPSFL